MFVTAADDIANMNRSVDISQRLTLLTEGGHMRTGPFAVIEFDNPMTGMASPVNRHNPGFVAGGRTAGGAREFVLPNYSRSELSGVTVRIVP